MPGTGSVRADNAAHVTPDGSACPVAPQRAAPGGQLCLKTWFQHENAHPLLLGLLVLVRRLSETR